MMLRKKTVKTLVSMAYLILIKSNIHNTLFYNAKASFHILEHIFLGHIDSLSLPYESIHIISY